MTSPEQRPAAGRTTRRSLGQLAKEWNIAQRDIWHAAQQLGVPATRMAATVSSGDERRLHDRLFAQTSFTRSMAALPPTMPVASSKRGADKSAYLAATAHAASAPVPPTDNQDVCTCCGIPVSTRQAQPTVICLDCIQQKHRDVHGPDRDLELARQHAERFRTNYLGTQQAVEKAQLDRRTQIDRANRWAAVLIRVLIDHDATGRCSVCKADPCPVWRRTERVNIGIARRVQDDYYPLHPVALDRKLADGIVTAQVDDTHADGL